LDNLNQHCNLNANDAFLMLIDKEQTRRIEMNKCRRLSFAVICTFVLACTSLLAEDSLKVLIITGQNNHNWKENSPIIKWILEDSGRFTVDMSTTPEAVPNAPRTPKGILTPDQKAKHETEMSKWKEKKAEIEKAGEEAWKTWRPKFSDYDVVLSDYNGKLWPDNVRADFIKYVQNGGGLVIVHAADNSFAEWPEYNEMIGVGGWGGRNEKSGPMIRWKDGKVVFDTTPGAGGTHGKQHEFIVETRDAEHPIMKGLPLKWKHAQDELYSKLRGPAKNLAVLATAFADPAQNGTGENEPIFMTISYGKGRVFHTVLGHGALAMSGLGFQVTLVRGTEWAATGKVTVAKPDPKDLSAEKAAIREIPAGILQKK